MKSGCIYGLLYADGVLKVGTTGNFRTRIRMLGYDRSAPLVAYIKSPRIEEIYYRAEMEILKRLRKVFRPYQRDEWFYCHDFGIARNLIHQFHRRYGTNETGWSVKTLDCRQLRQELVSTKEKQ